MISFGENELYQRYRGIPWGRFIFGHIPIRRPVTTVGKRISLTHKTKSNRQLFLVGKAIDVTRNSSATSEDINQLHDQYTKAMKELFEFHKNKYGLGHVEFELR